MHVLHPSTLLFALPCLSSLCIASPLQSPPTLHLASPTTTNLTDPPPDYHPEIYVPGAPIFVDMLQWGARIFLPELSDAIKDVMAWIAPNVRQHPEEAIPDGHFEYTHVSPRPDSRIVIDFKSVPFGGGLTWQDINWALYGLLTFFERDIKDWASREWTFDIIWTWEGKLGGGSIHTI